MSEVYDYFFLRHGRNSFDGSGSSLIACVRVGINFPNAYWQSQLNLMVFGDGYPRSLDICGHEVTHGVISSIGNGGVLDYVNQAGALNEAFADIFGEMVEARSFGTNDWLMGSYLGSTMRNLANPNAKLISGTTRPYPATMSEFIQPTDPFLNNFVNRDYGGVQALRFMTVQLRKVQTIRLPIPTTGRSPLLTMVRTHGPLARTTQPGMSQPPAS